MADGRAESTPNTQSSAQRGRVPPAPPTAVGTIDGEDGPLVLRRLVMEIEGALEEMAERHTSDPRNHELLEAHAGFLHSIAVLMERRLNERGPGS